MRSIVIALAVARILAMPCEAVAQSLDIGGIEIRIGQDQESVLTQLGAVYRLQNVQVNSESKSWSVYRRGAENEGIGSFWLTNGLIIAIEKRWEFAPNWPGRSSRALFSNALAETKRIGGARCEFRLEELGAEYGVFGFITSCGRYTLTYQLPGPANDNTSYAVTLTVK